MRTADVPAKLELTPDRSEIRANGSDLSFLTVRVTDKQGLTAPRADNAIKFSIEGPGEIVATDNGDPTSFESFQAPERKAFNGFCLVVVRSKAGRTGNIIVRATSGNLQQATTDIKSVRAR